MAASGGESWPADPGLGGAAGVAARVRLGGAVLEEVKEKINN